MAKLSRFILPLTLVLMVHAAHSAVPHKSLMEKIRRGEIEMPYYMIHRSSLLRRGVNAGYSPGSRPVPFGIHKKAAGAFRAVAILVDFTDNTSTVSASFFDNLLYGSAPGSVAHYYDEVSYGTLDIVTVHMPSSLGWFRAPQTYAYYVDGDQGFGSYPRNAQRLAQDAVTLANPYVNFANYDNDGDGYIDALIIIHSGTGAEVSGSDDDIWSHKWSIPPMYVDGVYAEVYSMQPEFYGTPGDMTCGVYCHELGHSVFGLVDLYDYGYDSKGAGDWALMASGSYNGPGWNGASPAHPTAWSRIWMGFATPTVVTANTTGAGIPAVVNTPSIFKLWTGGSPGSQYFLVENRQKTGYDAFLPGAGLLIYHIDDNQYGNNNDNQWYPGYTSYGHYLVAVEQADGLWELEKNVSYGDAGDPFPGMTGSRTFDVNSTPNSKNYSFADTDVAVRNISNSMPTMTADFQVTDAGPAESITVTSPNGGETWYAGSSRTITWTSSGTSGTVAIQYTLDSGSNWHSVSPGTADDGSHTWILPQQCSTQCRVMVSDADGSPADMSDSHFDIDGCGTTCDILAEAGCPEHCEGSRIEVPITVDMSGMPAPNHLLGSYSASLTWDASRLDYVSHAGGSTSGWGAPVVNATNTASGQLDFSAANVAGSSGLIHILTATFDVIGTAGDAGSEILSISAMAAAATFTDLIPYVCITDCDYVIESCGTLGDVNGDGLANSTDALIIMSCDVGMDVTAFCPMACGDVNSDGVINSTDALIIVSNDVGLSVPYPVGEPGCSSTGPTCSGCTP